MLIIQFADIHADDYRVYPDSIITKKKTNISSANKENQISDSVSTLDSTNISRKDTLSFLRVRTFENLSKQNEIIRKEEIKNLDYKNIGNVFNSLFGCSLHDFGSFGQGNEILI